MKARFDGKCKSCGDDIRKGKEIARNADEVWVHKHCVEELVDLPQNHISAVSYFYHVN